MMQAALQEAAISLSVQHPCVVATYACDVVKQAVAQQVRGASMQASQP